MKRVLSVLLAALLALGGCAGALADTDEAQKLAAVALLVKEQLGIGDDFNDFTSEYCDYGEKRIWTLNWYGKDSGIYVNCDTSGTIYEYNYNDYTDSYTYSSDFAPKFPSVESESLLPNAEAFLASVITADGEGWTPLYAGSDTYAYSVTAYTYTGSLSKNGYATDITLSVSVRMSDGKITYYYRSDAYSDYTGWNAPETLSDAAEARAKLEAGYTMELRYVLDGDDMTKAVLRYAPVQSGIACVDAETGEAVNVEALYEALSAMAGKADYAAGDYTDEGANRAALTQTELVGIDRLSGTLTKEQLDETVRSYAEFGLDESYALTSVNVNAYEENVQATLTYMREMSREMLETRYNFDPAYLDSLAAEGTVFCESKYVTLNAKTGALQYMYTYYPYSTGVYSYEGTEEEARASSEAFLRAHYPEYLDNSECTWSWFGADSTYYSPNASFDFTRTVNGVLFESNSIGVTINVETGLVDGLNVNWSAPEEVTFEAVENVITPEQALSAYLMRYGVELGYVGLPVEYADYNYRYEGRLCYRLVADESLREAYIEGVDPHTGECVITDYGVSAYAYGDVAGIAQKDAVEALAARGIGFAGGAFEPERALSLRDMLVLLLQAGAYRDAQDYSDEDLISIAYSLNILDGKDADADEALSRARLARMLVDMSGYGRSASLAGVFQCGFADDGEIAADDYGYIAIAKGLGVAAADADGRFRPNDAATRAEAAAMLYAFLTRAA